MPELMSCWRPTSTMSPGDDLAICHTSVATPAPAYCADARRMSLPLGVGMGIIKAVVHTTKAPMRAINRMPERRCRSTESPQQRRTHRGRRGGDGRGSFGWLASLVRQRTTTTWDYCHGDSMPLPGKLRDPHATRPPCSDNTAENMAFYKLTLLALLATATSAFKLGRVDMPSVPKVVLSKAATALSAAAITAHSEAAHAKSVLGVNGGLDFGPLAGDQPGGEGTGKALGINDDSLFAVFGVVIGTVFFLFAQWQEKQDDDEDFFDSYDSRRVETDNNRNRV